MTLSIQMFLQKSWLTFTRPQSLSKSISVPMGVALLAVCAQVRVPLPFSPVPVTGQTFGIALLSLLWGRKLGTTAVLTYLMVGLFGAPVFASSVSFWNLGPSLGYLVGMLGASLLMGSLKDRGFVRGFSSAWLAASLGSLLVLGSGVLGLKLVFTDQTWLEVLAMGWLPFVPGDLIKTTLVAAVVGRKFRT